MIIYFQKKIKYQGQTSNFISSAEDAAGWVRAKAFLPGAAPDSEGRKKPNPVTENLAPSWDFRGTKPITAEENIAKAIPQMSPCSSSQRKISSPKDPGSRKTQTFSGFLLSPLDKCASQASDKVKWTNPWFALRMSKHEAALEPSGDVLVTVSWEGVSFHLTMGHGGLDKIFIFMRLNYIKIANL